MVSCCSEVLYTQALTEDSPDSRSKMHSSFSGDGGQHTKFAIQPAMKVSAQAVAVVEVMGNTSTQQVDLLMTVITRMWPPALTGSGPTRSS